ncbi:MAG: hypothetical protein ACRDYC_01630 [Acidimicrobiales bacterium]
MRRVSIAATALVAALGLPGCAGTFIPSGSVTGCFRAIPVAQAEVHDSNAHLEGVHLVPIDHIKGRLAQALEQSGFGVDTPVCAVAFQDNFAPDQVTGAQPGVGGHYAIVVVTSKSLRLVTSYVTDHLPKNFGRRLI